MRVLVVEDEKAIRLGIVNWLNKSSFEVSEATNGKEGLKLLSSNKYDAVLLDVMMPEMDGIKLLKEIRNNLNLDIAVIMLTAKNDENDIVKALNYGADDYVIKPFSNRELEARLNANIRKKVKDDITVKSKLFNIDDKKFIISNKNGSEQLTRKELDLLTYFLINDGSIISKSELLEKIWGNLDSSDTRSVDIHVSKLRKKLEKMDIKEVIVTKRSIGYGFVSKNAK